MTDESGEKPCWMIAVWPGMGQVATGAGYYLMAKLGMQEFTEFSSEKLFDLDYVEVKDGLITSQRRPRSRIFRWGNPEGDRDLLVFVGEAQPTLGKYEFCQKLVEFATEHDVERIFTFAAMATEMHPQSRCRVFGAATEGESLREFQQLEIEALKDGQIGGLNGILLGVAAEAGLRGTCLLGEIPHVFSQIPFPKASLEVLEVFSTMAGIQIDLTELREHSETVENQLGRVWAQIEQALRQQQAEQEEEYSPEPERINGLNPEDQQHIEDLFQQAETDRSKSYELKRELDRLEVFKEYEDRFLNLFKKDD